jgi:hypothetical protein
LPPSGRLVAGGSPSRLLPDSRLVAEGATAGDVLAGVRAAMSLPDFRPRSWAVFERFIRHDRAPSASAARGARRSTEGIVSHRMRALKQIHDEALAEEAAHKPGESYG